MYFPGILRMDWIGSYLSVLVKDWLCWEALDCLFLNPPETDVKTLLP